MSERDNFTGGLLIGTLFGSVVGGLVGFILTSRANSSSPEKSHQSLEESSTPEYTKESHLSLEDKIAQLNLAIDDVRQKLNSVNPTQE